MDEEPQKNIPIRRIVRSKETGLFLSPDGRWIEQAEAAANLESITEAVEFCVRHNVKNSELILQSGSEQFDVILDIKNPA